MSNQSVSQKQEERDIFKAFLSTCPQFAGESIVEWEHVEDPPDILCITQSKRRVGIEIAQWANEQEMKSGKMREANIRTIERAIGSPQPRNTSRYDLAIYSPRPTIAAAAKHERGIRSALEALIFAVTREEPSNHRRGIHIPDLRRFTPLDAYLERIVFTLGPQLPDDVPWIVPVGAVDTFDSRTMAEPLLAIIEKKVKKCATLRTQCDELYLLIAHDEAISYCSPIYTSSFQSSLLAAQPPLDASAERFKGVWVLLSGDVPRARRLK